jgi:excisionase family DNA binding protein
MRVTNQIPKRLLRTKDAALYLGMSPGKLRRLTQSGELPIIQHDERAPWLYDLRDLDEHIEKSKHRLSDFY